MDTPSYMTTTDFIHGLLTGLAEQDRVKSLASPNIQTIRAVQAAMIACRREGVELECDLAGEVTGRLIGVGEGEHRLVRSINQRELIIQHHNLGFWRTRSSASILLRQRMATAFYWAYNDGRIN
jgi:hypothetical protein